MPPISRRRFLRVVAALPGLTIAGPSVALPTMTWRGVALGAAATIRLTHPDARVLIEGAIAEIDRLEGVFSLYRAQSQLSVLNRDGTLPEPSFELLECLALSSRVHAASGGLFDPSIQPLWAAYATAYAEGTPPNAAILADAVARVGWAGVQFDETGIRLRPGMALTLNGIAQGFIADRVSAWFRANGVTDVLIDTGEIAALGDAEDDNGWPVGILGDSAVNLLNRALATSAPLGTTFDPAGRVGHILDPRSGLPARSPWRQVSISAPAAAVADALSTAACMLPDAKALELLLTEFRDALCESLLPA